MQDLAGCKQPAPVSVSPLKIPRSTPDWFHYKPLCVDRLAFHPKIHHLNSCPGGTILSLSMSDNAIMTTFYPRMEIIHWMSLLSVEAFITTV